MNINISKTKSQFFKLISLLCEGKEKEIIICHNGMPAASLKAYESSQEIKRVGIAKGKIPSMSQSEFESFTIDDLFDDLSNN